MKSGHAQTVRVSVAVMRAGTALANSIKRAQLLGDGSAPRRLTPSSVGFKVISILQHFDTESLM